MKLLAFCKDYDYDYESVRDILLFGTSGVRYSEGLSHKLSIDDRDIDKLIDYIEDTKIEAERAKQAKAEAISKAKAAIMISHSPILEGWKVVEYSEFIMADGTTSLDRDFESITVANGGESSMDIGIGLARLKAIDMLRSKAYELHCNAVLGISISYSVVKADTVNAFTGGLILLPYSCIVSITGNAAKIERIKP